jgi:uncharacterized protein DUF4258
MVFTRHARNGMRRLGVTAEQVEAIIAAPERLDRDPEGRPRYVGMAGQRRIRIVAALDNPDLIVTVHERRN